MGIAAPYRLVLKRLLCAQNNFTSMHCTPSFTSFNQSVSPLISQPPLISFKLNNNLQIPWLQDRYPLTSSQALLSVHVKAVTLTKTTILITRPKSFFQVTDHFDCTSTNVIYCIICALCDKLQIGEIGED